MTMTRVVEDGVEFFTIVETGESGMSISGVARLCAVSETSIRSFLSRNAVRTLDAKKRLKVFQEEGFHFEPSWWKRITIVSSDICANIIEHYAYESKQKRTAEALFAYRKFAKMGIEAWIQSITGWRKEPLEPKLPDLTLPREAVRILKNAQESKTAYRLFLHLHDVGQLGDRPTIAKICTDLQITRPTFYKTAKRLKELSLLPTWFELESRNYPERFMRDWLHGELGGTIEAPTVYGPIDLLTDEEVIEVKRVEDWKEAIGHVMVKGSCYPDRFKCLLLFGEKLRNVSLIEESCDRIGIQVGFQRVKYVYDNSDDLLAVKRLR